MSDIKEALPEHSKLFSPSAYKLDKICKARVILSQSIAEEPPGEAAVRGSAMHDIADEILKIRLRSNISETQKKARIKKKLETLIDDNEREMVMKHVDWVIDLRGRILKQVKGKYIEHFEARLSDLEDSSGTLDYGLVVFGGQAHILVSDLKTGQINVDVEYNDQAMRYLLMIIAENVPEGMEIGSAHLCINQPSTSDEPKVWKVPIEYIDEFRKEFTEHRKEIYRMLKDGVEDSDFNVTEHCGFCPALRSCPAQFKRFENAVSKHVVTPNEVPDVEGIPLDKRIAIHEAKKVIEKFMNQVSYSLQLELEAGKEVPGYKLVNSVQRRQWKNDRKVSEIAKDLRALGCKSVTTSKLIGIGEVEKQLKKKGEKNPSELIDDLTKLTESKKVIAPLSDKREAIAHDASIKKHLTKN